MGLLVLLLSWTQAVPCLTGSLHGSLSDLHYALNMLFLCTTNGEETVWTLPYLEHNYRSLEG